MIATPCSPLIIHRQFPTHCDRVAAAASNESNANFIKLYTIYLVKEGDLM